MPTPAPIDPRGPRFDQGVLTIFLLVAFVADLRLLVPLMAVVLLLAVALGPRYSPFLRVYGDLVGPRLHPPKHLEDPRPPRFAAMVGAAFLLAASLSFVLGHQVMAWALALLVAVLAGLGATSGLCIGCELYLYFARRRGVHVAT
jgi:hypothetical protein